MVRRRQAGPEVSRSSEHEIDGELDFLLGAAIVAAPPHGNPLWMLVDPLRDVGLRIHHALVERHVSRERKMLIFALTR
jgi:hypothetical protein